MESAPFFDLRVESGIASCLGAIGTSPVVVGAASSEFDQEIANTVAGLRRCHAGRAPAEIPGLAAGREFYRSMGLDPTKTRPSSEALLRRVLRGDPFPRRSPAIDAANLLAVRLLLPIGLYDADRIAGPVVFRLGGPDDSFAGVAKPVVHLSGRPVLADSVGPFGNPTADSARTGVTSATSALWLVIFAPAGYPTRVMQSHLDDARELVSRYLVLSGSELQSRSAVFGQ